MPQMPRTATWHLPVADLETREYWEAARGGRLLIKECRACGESFFYPRTYCPRCWSSDTEWKESTGRGRVYTFTVVHQNDLPPFNDRVPYVVAIVELEEGGADDVEHRGDRSGRRPLRHAGAGVDPPGTT